MSQIYISGLLCVNRYGRFIQKSKDGLLNAADAIEKGLRELEKANNNDHDIYRTKLDEFCEALYRLVESNNAARTISRILDPTLDGWEDLEDIMMIEIGDGSERAPQWVLEYTNNVKNACKAVYEVMFCLHYYSEEESDIDRQMKEDYGEDCLDWRYP